MLDRDRWLFGIFKEDWLAGVAIGIGGVCFLAISHFARDYLSEKTVITLALAYGAMGTAFGVLLWGRHLQNRRAINWIIRTTQWDVEKVKTHAPELLVEVQSEGNAREVSDGHWPWGEHHTEHLGHLEAAARKFWTNYDPNESDTAPTNEMVSDWLQAERKVSKDKAKAIASILRADGVKTGPRRLLSDP